jgi:hypothetical protein
MREYLQSIAPAAREQMKQDVQAHLNRAHFVVTFIGLLGPIVAKWGDRVMNKRFLDGLLKPEVGTMLQGISGAMHRADLELWYISGDRVAVGRVTEAYEYVTSINFRYKGDLTWGPGGHRRDTAPGDLKITLRFPGLRYSAEAFTASTERELRDESARVRLLSDLVIDKSRIGEMVTQYNQALESLKAVCSNEYAQCYPVSRYFRSGQL